MPRKVCIDVPGALEQLRVVNKAFIRDQTMVPETEVRGELIGVNLAVVQNAQNIGFAIPINKILNLLKKIRIGDSSFRDSCG